MDWTKANEKCGVGTFILTATMVAILVWQITNEPNSHRQGNVMESLTTWWPVLAASLAIVIAACIHYLAATARNRDAAVVRDGIITAKNQEIESLRQQITELQGRLSKRKR